ncbi:MAG: hypothetical protein K2M75_03175 [Clostridia bacterium]|nr:hypothetical protein [Clostridia bacterium]
MGLFKKDKTVIKTTLHINARLQPEHRVSYYEDHLKGIFKKEKLGSVIGGSSVFFNDGGIASCNVDIDCYDDKIIRLIELLHYIPMAKGSRLTVFRPDGRIDREYPLGELEGMGIYLNGVDLPKEVYKKCDINYVVDEIFRLLELPPIIYSYWQGPRETALYFYSGSFSSMRNKISSLLASYPLCQGCRVTQIS